MRFVSTGGTAATATLREALFRGLAPDGGLYLPEALPPLPPNHLNALPGMSADEIGGILAAHLLADEVEEESRGRPVDGEEAADGPGDRLRTDTLAHIAAEALSFPIPLLHLRERIRVLELFHGPTFAFKDVGARFMARLMSRLLDSDDPPLTILAATSGDTGSAVASAFLEVQGTRSVVLYPEGQVSTLQERLFTTLGGNVTAVAVAGTFDDCQKMVKEAFLDEELADQLHLTSANSINIGRLLPQIFYYFHAWAQLAREEGPDVRVVVSVPSGNLGNLCAGLMAKRLGLPVARFVAACNANDVFPTLLRTGRYEPTASKRTLSNAMDVGDPSNLARILALYDGNVSALRKDVTASSHTDQETLGCIARVHGDDGYILDPHSAVGWVALERVLEWRSDSVGILLSTAHPAKFGAVVEEATGHPLPVPPALAEYLSREPEIVRIPPVLPALKEVLLSE